jgi:hypothetical protein
VTGVDTGVCLIGDNPDPAIAETAARVVWRAADRVDAAMRDPAPAPLRRFIWDIQSMVELAESEREILVIGRDLMAQLVAGDDWLPLAFARPDDGGCRHYLLYGDGLDRFAVVSTVLQGAQAMLVRQDGVWEIFRPSARRHGP